MNNLLNKLDYLNEWTLITKQQFLKSRMTKVAKQMRGAQKTRRISKRTALRWSTLQFMLFLGKQNFAYLAANHHSVL